MIGQILSGIILVPTADEATPAKNVAETATDTVTSAQWWLDSFLPVAIRVALIIVVVLFLRWVIMKAIRKAVTRMADAATGIDVSAGRAYIVAERKAMRAKTLGSLFNNIVTITLLTLMILLIMGELGFDLGPLIAGAGILGIALGFGAQSLVADFLSGIFILMEDQYGVGDVVDVGDASGTVEEVQLRTTRIRAVDGSLWFVRNGEIIRVGNKSQDWSRGVLDIGIAYEADVPKAKKIIGQVGADFADDTDWNDQVLETPEVWGVQELAADSVILRMVVKTHPGAQFAAERELRERIKAALDGAGIEIPFQQRTVWIRHEDNKPGNNEAVTDLRSQPGTSSVDRV